ncbi:putative transcriptional regulatory protein [Cyphellophora attinorum]|uniref:Putative transcriptional regulatory protein n=1 Tax=Cyphellophora attinorum TaxID=1664694 RepID=A0A0N0NI07_9EURO|nr:putative transcriptional regulatory protein [Phialophora attinorum]KPI35291.1 putative transcriptional regulatory protein [Phialophora attinorum]
MEDMVKELMEWRRSARDNDMSLAPRAPAATPAGVTPNTSGRPSDLGGDPGSGRDHGLRIPDPVDLSLDGMTVITNSLQQPGTTFLGKLSSCSCPSSNIYFLRQISNALSSPLLSPQMVDRQHSSTLSRPLLSVPASPRQNTRVISTAGSNPVDMYLLPPADYGLRLLELFFADSGTLFPYIHREGLLASYQALFRQKPPSIPGTFMCLLNTIFAMATYHSSRDELDHHDALLESDVFYSRAKLLASKLDLEHTDTQTVQALLLMHQYCMATQRSAQIWTSHAATIRVAIQLGLHSASRLRSLSPIEAEVRKRIWFGCIILDRTLSTTFGRPPAIPNSFVRLPLPENMTLDALSKGEAVDSTASDGDFGSVYLFTATSELYLLQGEIIEHLYGNNLEDDPDIQASESLTHVMNFERKLIAWKRNLPARLQKTPWLYQRHSDHANTSKTSNFDRLSVVMALRYLNARLLLRRTLLMLCLKGGEHLLPDGTFTHEERSYFDKVVINEITICESDAFEVLQIISSTNPYPSLRTSWWFSAYYCFTAALTVFSCLLLRTRCKRLWQEASLKETTIDPHRGLQMAVEIFRAYGNNTGAQRAEKTLNKLIEIQSEIRTQQRSFEQRATQVQGPAQAYPLSAIENRSVLHAGNMEASHMSGHTCASQEQPSYPEDFGYSMQFPLSCFADSNLDLFAELGGFDPDLVASTSG